MKKIVVMLAMLAGIAPAAAQQSHGHGSMKGPNGGVMHDVAGVHAELVVSGRTLTLNLFDESNKPASSAGFAGSVLVVSAAGRETVQFAPSSPNALKAEARSDIAAGAAVTVVLRSPAGKSGQVKY